MGSGIDIVEVPRLAAALERFGRRFLERIFTPAEISYCDGKANRVERYAARFAAKEAAMKAIGTGLRRGVSWQDFEVQRQPGSRPTLALKGQAARFAEQLGARHIALSISHTEQHAIAQVILES